MRRLAPLLVLVALLLLPAGQGQAALSEARGTLPPGEARAFLFPMEAGNATAVRFHLSWEDEGARFRLLVLDPTGRALPVRPHPGGGLLAEAPVGGAAGNAFPQEAADLAVSEGHGAGGEWRLVVSLEEAPGPATFTLVVEVARLEAAGLRVVTLEAPAPSLGPPLLAAGAGVACALGVRLAAKWLRRNAHSVAPAGDKAASSEAGQGACAPEG